MKSVQIPMTEEELRNLEAQLAAAAPEEGIVIAFDGDFSKGKIKGKHPISWNVDFEFDPNILTINADELFTGKVIEGVEDKLAAALAEMRRTA